MGDEEKKVRKGREGYTSSWSVQINRRRRDAEYSRLLDGAAVARHGVDQ